MANVKKGNLTAPPQWWKHLKDWKRVFWKSERQAQKRDIKERDDKLDNKRLALWTRKHYEVLSTESCKV